MEDFIGIIVAILVALGGSFIDSISKARKKRKLEAERRRGVSVSEPYTSQSYVPSYVSHISEGSRMPEYQPLEVPEQYVSEPLPGDVTEPQIQEPVSAAVTTPSVADEALQAHYARWRNAIIDAQIITPKF
ncbi:MAG: hypothetical protein NC098_07145 [Lachnoclostridium sp.]|nr:hypothetical protein [Lachnoclostridium sp.]